MRTINSLQQLMACLTTHPRDLENALRNPEHFIQSFEQLKSDEKSEFTEFFKIHSKRFTSATLLLSKKRWEEAVFGLEFIIYIFPDKEIKNLWASYTASYSLEESIPQSPLLDALKFILFIKNKDKNSLLISDLLNYQLIKLQLLVDIEKEISVGNCNVDEDRLIDTARVNLNNSIVSVKFSYKVSTLIRFINQNKYLPSDSYDYHSEETFVNPHPN